MLFFSLSRIVRFSRVVLRLSCSLVPSLKTSALLWLHLSKILNDFLDMGPFSFVFFSFIHLLSSSHQHLQDYFSACLFLFFKMFSESFLFCFLLYNSVQVLRRGSRNAERLHQFFLRRRCIFPKHVVLSLGLYSCHF